MPNLVTQQKEAGVRPSSSSVLKRESLSIYLSIYLGPIYLPVSIYQSINHWGSAAKYKDLAFLILSIHQSLRMNISPEIHNHSLCHVLHDMLDFPARLFFE
jgi:hypothetical protein